MRREKKIHLLQVRRWRTRKKIVGTAERPRMSVRFTNRNIHVQFIDDTTGHTLGAATTLSKSLAGQGNLAANVVSAEQVGKIAAEVAKANGIERVVFDRSGARYHGKVKALADAARAGGLQF